jgi:hypothetical protein
VVGVDPDSSKGEEQWVQPEKRAELEWRKEGYTSPLAEGVSQSISSLHPEEWGRASKPRLIGLVAAGIARESKPAPSRGRPERKRPKTSPLGTSLLEEPIISFFF